MKSLPDFIIAGAPKCGTTALWHFLNEMPEICMATLKEPKFFSELKGEMTTKITGNGPRTSGNFNKGFDWYAQLFSHCKEGQLSGEASTLYFCNKDAAEKIHTYVPGVKLIFMLRHPADRTYSHYWQEYKLGFDFPDFETMSATNHLRYQFYVDVSHYKKHLERFFSLFRRDQVLMIILEDFRNNPSGEYERVAEFLGLPKNSLQNIDLEKEHNEQVIPNNRKLAKLYTVLQQSPLLGMLPTGMRKYLGKTRRRMVGLNTQPLKEEAISETLRNSLNNIFHDDILYVQNLLNRKNDLWIN